MSEAEHRVLSGVQPSGTLHLGNYFGAICQHIALQDEFPGESYFFIADYHSLTTIQDGPRLRELVADVAVTYLALGLDPNKACLWRQSDVPEVCELTWLLSTVTGMGLLQRAHSYKDKVANGITPSCGLFTYPVLMAADILAPRSTLVPVGKDQVQHIEMAQDMATHFNEAFDTKVLRRPQARLSSTPYVPGIDGRKMSKSYDNTLPMFESRKRLKKLVGKIVTDSTELGQPMTWEGDRVAALLELFADEATVETYKGYYAAGQRDGEPFGWGHAKMLLAGHIDEHFAEARARREQLLADPKQVEDVLQAGAAKARKLIGRTVHECRLAAGLL